MDFTANMYLDVYGGHIASFDKMEKEQNLSYHSMMANLYQLVVYEFSSVLVSISLTFLVVMLAQE